MSDLKIIVFVISGAAIILISLYVVISMTKDINETNHAKMQRDRGLVKK